MFITELHGKYYLAHKMSIKRIIPVCDILGEVSDQSAGSLKRLGEFELKIWRSTKLGILRNKGWLES